MGIYLIVRMRLKTFVEYRDVRGVGDAVGKMKTYFKRTFVGVLNEEFKLNINNDSYNGDGLLKELECKLQPEEFKQVKCYIGRLISFRAFGVETRIRKECEFFYNIIIDKIESKVIIDNEITCILKITEVEE